MPESALTVGDPAAMRDLARLISGRAELVGAATTGVMGKLGEAVFEGAAADRIRAAMGDAQTQVTDSASRLRDIAADLLADADEVERQNAALKAAAERAEEAARQARERAATPGAGTDPAGTDPVPTAGTGVTTTTAPTEPTTPTPVPDVPVTTEGVTVTAAEDEEA